MKTLLDNQEVYDLTCNIVDVLNASEIIVENRVAAVIATLAHLVTKSDDARAGQQMVKAVLDQEIEVALSDQPGRGYRAVWVN